MEERLQKYMAQCGVASRRKCEEYILEKRVSVNGEVICELGTKVDADKDIVEFDGNIIKREIKKIYILLNKPEGYICSAKDEKGRKTVLDLIDVNERIYPIGRLDYDSSGLILLTNDGDIYNKIIHPKKEIIKVYSVKVKGCLNNNTKELLEKGVDIGGFITSPAKVEIINYDKQTNTTSLTVGIHEGKNRQVRRMCAAFDHEVISLKRISIGNLKLGYLKKGQYRDLTEDEIKYIKNL